VKKRLESCKLPKCISFYRVWNQTTPDNIAAEVAKDGVADNHDRTILACYGFHSVALGFE
jgi:hypothetical protein